LVLSIKFPAETGHIEPAASTRNRTAEVLPVPPGDPPEVPESGDELLRLSEAISSRLQP
jgi:hypothetical protein